MLCLQGPRLPCAAHRRLPKRAADQACPDRHRTVVFVSRDAQHDRPPALPMAVINLAAGVLIFVAGSAVGAMPAVAFGVRDEPQEKSGSREGTTEP